VTSVFVATCATLYTLQLKSTGALVLHVCCLYAKLCDRVLTTPVLSDASEISFNPQTLQKPYLSLITYYTALCSSLCSKRISSVPSVGYIFCWSMQLPLTQPAVTRSRVQASNHLTAAAAA